MKKIVAILSIVLFITCLFCATNVYAAEKGNVETIKFLAHHIDVDTKGRGGKTALHVAAESNQKDAAVTLIQLNANTEIRDDGNKIPIQRASIFKRTFWDMFWQMEAANCRAD